MKKELNHNVIVSLIIKELFDELLPEEKLILKKWVTEKQDNKSLYEKIRNAESFNLWSTTFPEVDNDSAWESISSVIGKNRTRRLWVSISKYAAAVLLPLIIISGILYFAGSGKNSNIQIVKYQEIKPGTEKALLILANGKSILLDSSQDLSIKEIDGTSINKLNGSLNYSKSTQIASAKPLYNTIIIPRGGEYNLVLSDSTHIFLNSMSEIKYPVQFKGNFREIELTGEAYFEVSKDRHKPFIVKTKGVAVEVLGTKFNVSAYENSPNVVTTLVEGKVSLKSSGSTLPATILQPSEQAVYNAISGKTEVEKVDVNLYIGWVEGRFIFHDTRLDDIMISLSRWYSTEVFFKNPLLKEIRFSGNLNRSGTIQEILDIIQSTEKVKIEVEQKNIVISEKVK